MNQLISKITLSAIAATFMFGAVAARADVYTGDTGHYLQAPQGYQTTTTNRQTYNGQGMGYGQLQAGNQPAQPLTVTTTPASSRMLPQGSATTMPMQAAPMPMAQTAQPMVQTTRIQAASMPAAQPSVQTLAAMEPAAGSAFDSSTNVQVAPSCGTPTNHRQHKGINTSTTVGNDCFN